MKIRDRLTSEVHFLILLIWSRLNTHKSPLKLGKLRPRNQENKFLFWCEHYNCMRGLATGFSLLLSVAQSCLTLCNPMDCKTPGSPVPHHLQKFDQFQVHCIGDAIQPSHPLTTSSPALNLSQHQGFFQWVGCSHQVTNTGASDSASVLSVSIQGWFPLKLTGFSLQCDKNPVIWNRIT